MDLPLEVDPNQLNWRPTGRAGIWLHPVHPEDLLERHEPTAAVTFIRMDPGCGYAEHRHLGAEEVFVLRGGYRDALGTYRKGEFVRYEAGSSHKPVALAGEEACILLAIARGGIEILRS